MINSAEDKQFHIRVPMFKYKKKRVNSSKLKTPELKLKSQFNLRKTFYTNPNNHKKDVKEQTTQNLKTKTKTNHTSINSSSTCIFPKGDHTLYTRQSDEILDVYNKERLISYYEIDTMTHSSQLINDNDPPYYPKQYDDEQEAYLRLQENEKAFDMELDNAFCLLGLDIEYKQ